MINKPNLLIIGASGGVGKAFLKWLAEHKKRLNKIVLVDKSDQFLCDSFISPRELSYDFIKININVQKDRRTYVEMIEHYAIDVVIDLSLNETRPMLEVTDALGVSYINTGIANRRGESFANVVLDVIKRKDYPWRAPHILCAGMNPGIVNMWVRQGVERFGLPKGIVHFEYDNGQPLQGWLPLITWSKETFLDEIINDPAGYMDGKDKLRFLYPNPLKNRIEMKDMLCEILDMKEYPCGYLLLHEENITIAQHYDIPSRFLFAIHPRTMSYLEGIYDKNGRVPQDALILGDNRNVGLRGAATVGVIMQYQKQKVYLFNTTNHANIQGVSGSCWQVAVGLNAALFTLLNEPLPSRIYFMEDLFGTSCETLVSNSLPMQERIIKNSLEIV